MELNQKLEEVNTYLEEQSKAREKIDQMRDDNDNMMRKEFEKTKKELSVIMCVFVCSRLHVTLQRMSTSLCMMCFYLSVNEWPIIQTMFSIINPAFLCFLSVMNLSFPVYGPHNTLLILRFSFFYIYLISHTCYSEVLTMVVLLQNVITCLQQH